MKAVLRHPFTIAFAINLFFLATCIAFGNLRFGALDDYFMAAVLSGAFGNDYNPHLYFVNALYGYALIPLYHLFPKVGWYYIGEMAGVFLSFTTITYIILKKVGLRWGALLSSALLLFTSQHFYLSVQFTQCAAIYAAAGMATALYGINESRYKITAFGAFLIFWGAMMRWEAVLMGFPILAITMAVQFKDCLKHWKTIVITAVILAGAIEGARLFDRNLYASEPYKTYAEFQGPRSAFGDGNDYDKDEVVKDLKRDGKSVEDYNMLCQWRFYDTEAFATDSLRAMLPYIHKHKYPLSNFQSPLEIIGNLSTSVHDRTCWIFFIFGIFILVTNPKRGAYPWLALLAVLGLIAYLHHINRAVIRVENGFWIYATLLTIPHWKNIPQIATQKIHKALTIGLAVASTAILLAHTYSLSQIQPNRQKQATYDKVFDYIEQHPQTMFLFSMPQFEQLPEYKNPPYKAEPVGSLKRYVSIGYWTAYLPDVTESLKEFNITNPMKEVVNDNVIMVGDGFLGKYLERHYYDSVAIDTVLRIGRVNFFKYSVKEAE